VAVGATLDEALRMALVLERQAQLALLVRAATRGGAPARGETA
jgi:ribulose-5-phosphate 4-epimerase/fuculose-1-phosphate aldolase